MSASRPPAPDQPIAGSHPHQAAGPLPAPHVSRVLGVDYGTRRVGLALSDPTRTLASGLPTLERKSGEPLVQALERLARTHDAGEVLLGLPLNMDGTRGPRAEEVEGLAEELRSRLAIPVTLWDERLTTVRAHRVLRESGMGRRSRRARVDRLSAVLILQNYLDAGAPSAATPGSGVAGSAAAGGAEKEKRPGWEERGTPERRER